MGQPEHAKRTQAERIAGLIESAEPTDKGTVLTMRLYLYPDGNATTRPREGFRDRGGDGLSAGVPCGKDVERLLATIAEIVDGARPAARAKTSHDAVRST